MSQPPRRPSVKPSTAGATPNEMTSASESRSAAERRLASAVEPRHVAVEDVAQERDR